MAGQYSHRQFFRHVPNHQLAAYFKSNNVDLGIDAFVALPETEQAIN